MITPGYPREERLADIIARRDPGYEQISPPFRPEQTVGEVLDQLGGINYGRYFVAGTPTVVADAIERWLDEDDIDGINLVQYLSFETARDFIELVVPELRRRGRYRESYRDGETLRERLFGPGHARLPAHHFGARYRDPTALRGPADPLRFPEVSPAAELSTHELRERTVAPVGHPIPAVARVGDEESGPAQGAPADALGEVKVAVLEGSRVGAQGEEPTLVARGPFAHPAGGGEVRFQAGGKPGVGGVHGARMVVEDQPAHGRQVVEGQLPPRV